VSAQGRPSAWPFDSHCSSAGKSKRSPCIHNACIFCTAAPAGFQQCWQLSFASAWYLCTFELAANATPIAVTQGSQAAPHAVQGFSASIDDVPVLLLIDTAGCDMEEQAEEDGDSKRNDGEAKVGFMCAITNSMSGSMTST